MKRSGKFYLQNEKEVMESLGLKQTPGSGNQWLIKEDGQNDFIICQLKSTDAQSIKINQKDIRILEKNAMVEHKYPVFAIQFLNTGEVWLMAKPEDFPSVSGYIETGKAEKPNDIFDVENEEQNKNLVVKNKIKSSKNARNNFFNQKAKMFDRTKSAR